MVYQTGAIWRLLIKVLIQAYNYKYLASDMLNSPFPIPGGINHNPDRKSSVFCWVFFFAMSIKWLFSELIISNQYNSVSFFYSPPPTSHDKQNQPQYNPNLSKNFSSPFCSPNFIPYVEIISCEKHFV